MPTLLLIAHGVMLLYQAIADSLRRELYPWNLSVSVINAGEIETPLLKSFEKEAAAAKANLAKRSEQAVDYYGAYYDNFKPTRAKFVGKVRDTNKAIEHAIRSKYPKTRYTVAAKAMLKSHLYPTFFLGALASSILACPRRRLHHHSLVVLPSSAA